ncbi:SDR family oxidoreductase [Jatrophihabitans cynanchi]|jgi:NAD(P)-dependent dehydrogenase (short-subunit alcohol dehydrogenase family)|uniref:SDR family oxidoreductase n=1 Tax=Jatrophihabitans cynanchi TaxID=2944128 RepID=A0ABY7JUZ0_9ACTN|nr:SDR family oxidoreductase [Jatrophihabitans sp. SB3-54]WAX56365.1 SDR family oxidoreductase [Jatrophihabitans sp. SB3-54]
MTRRAVVTGSASGIGKATAVLLQQQGVDVLGVDLKDADVCADLGTPDGRSAAVEAIGERGGLDVVVACAGITGANAAVPSVNFFGVVDLLTGLRPLLAAGNDPRAALISSVSSVHPTDEALVAACLAQHEVAARRRSEELLAEQAWALLYSSSKAALARWVRRAAITPEWAGAGIALNAVGPGVVLTPMSGELMNDPVMKPIMDAAVPMPLNGYAPAEAVAAPLAFLVSPANTHVTGQVLFVDGGAEATLRGDTIW